MNYNFSEELEIAKHAAKEIGKIQMKHFRTNLKVIRKTPKEFVSNVDVECQKMANKLLKEKFDYFVLSEEKRIHEENDADLFWIVDPMDGTHNFIAGVPNFGVSIALANRDKFVLGVIYLPFFDELYHAMKDEGAFMNEKPISVSNNKDLSKSMITYDNQFYLNEYSFERYKRLIDHCFTTRITGSAIYDFSLIASGKIDARIWNKTKIFDFAGGITIVCEAGGKITGFNGEEINPGSKEVIASNGHVHNQLIDILRYKTVKEV